MRDLQPTIATTTENKTTGWTMLLWLEGFQPVTPCRLPIAWYPLILPCSITQSIHWKKLGLELLLEGLMLLAPVSLDVMGAIGEYLVDRNPSTSAAYTFKAPRFQV